MRGMKITVDAAMRARDVSRPRAEHEALARVAEEAGPKPAEAADPVPVAVPGPGQGRRRRRRR